MNLADSSTTVLRTNKATIRSTRGRRRTPWTAGIPVTLRAWATTRGHDNLPTGAACQRTPHTIPPRERPATGTASPRGERDLPPGANGRAGDVRPRADARTAGARRAARDLDPRDGSRSRGAGEGAMGRPRPVRDAGDSPPAGQQGACGADGGRATCGQGGRADRPQHRDDRPREVARRERPHAGRRDLAARARGGAGPHAAALENGDPAQRAS